MASLEAKKVESGEAKNMARKEAKREENGESEVAVVVMDAWRISAPQTN